MPAFRSCYRAVALAAIFLAIAGFGAQDAPTDPDLVAHEWGTFTSIAGPSGRAISWYTLRDAAELPNFVNHLNGAQFKAGLRGTIRMETPVLYFYSPKPTAVSVKVELHKGVMTEWYPAATRVTPNPEKLLAQGALFHGMSSGTLAWDAVTVSPGLVPKYPSGDEGKQYYAARQTGSAPLVVKTLSGDEQEKFLFYRGVSAASLPLAATLSADGQAHIRSLGREEIPEIIRFERHGDELGYRIAGAVPSEIAVDTPEMTASLESLRADLQDILVRQGLFPDEARAMVETWKDNWFEEGSRLIYIVPRNYVDRVVPLTVSPAPSQTTRVFVGRLELVTPATEQAVAEILASRDIEGLQKYRRFLDAILTTMKAHNPGAAAELDKELDETYRSPMRQQPAN